MQFDDVILGRRSIRGYKPDPVPKALIAEIIGLAMRAPSSMNTQPWNFYVITGEPLDRIRAGNTERMVAGTPQSREFRTGQAFAGKHRDRQVGVAKQLFSAMGIERDNKDKRQDWVLRGFRQFDAPVCVIITYDRALDGSGRWFLDEDRRGDAVASHHTPEQAYLCRWARAVSDHAVIRLRQDYEADGRLDWFEQLKGFLDGSNQNYEELSRELSVAPATLRKRVLKMRERFRALLRAEVEQTVASRSEVDDELRELIRLLMNC